MKTHRKLWAGVGHQMVLSCLFSFFPLFGCWLPWEGVTLGQVVNQEGAHLAGHLLALLAVASSPPGRHQRLHHTLHPPHTSNPPQAHSLCPININSKWFFYLLGPLHLSYGCLNAFSSSFFSFSFFFLLSLHICAHFLAHCRIREPEWSSFLQCSITQ